MVYEEDVAEISHYRGMLWENPASESFPAAWLAVYGRARVTMGSTI